jgi:hypothetical protein
MMVLTERMKMRERQWNMKQTFNNLRAILTRHKENMPVVVLAEMLAEIDEAEAKWESDCCEWKRLAIGNSVWKTSCGKQRTIILNRDENFCPYCGKPIKIAEVE